MKKTLLFLFTIVLISSGFYLFYTDKINLNFSFKNQSHQSIKTEKSNPVPESKEKELEKIYNKIIELLAKNNSDEYYDKYLSPESKQRVTKEEFNKGSAEFNRKVEEEFGGKVLYEKYNINKITVINDTGYIERTHTVCFDQECSDKYEFRGYLKFININNQWYRVFGEKPTNCIRDEAYDMPEEFKRALSLIIQRHEQSGNSDNAYALKNIYNCLKIEYSSSEEIGGAEGVFEFQPAQSREEYNIKVSRKYFAKDDLLTAVLLAHELTHVFQYANNHDITSPEGCFKAEAEAFQDQNYFITNLLNSEEKKALWSRVYTKTPEIIEITYVLREIPKQKGDLYFDKALNFVKSLPEYQKQCNK